MIFCYKCSCEIEKHRDLKYGESKNAIKSLKLSDFGTKKRGSIADLYYSKLQNGKTICFYYGKDFGEARIMIEGTGHWITSMNFFEETPEKCLQTLQKMI